MQHGAESTLLLLLLLLIPSLVRVAAEQRGERGGGRHDARRVKLQAIESFVFVSKQKETLFFFYPR